MGIRILIADDHPIVRHAVRSVIRKESGMQLVGQAKTGEEAIEMAMDSKPDIILMDIRMAGCGGIVATRKLTAELPGSRIIALSGYCEELAISQMFGAGARGFMLKSSEPEEIIEAINAVMAGKHYLDDRVTDLVIDGYTRPDAKAAPAGLGSLSGREKEVLRLVAEGRSSKEIAADLGISARTVETHRFNVMRKLDIHNTPGLIKYALREGLTSLEP
ncbi:response regulator [Verrucomicrobiota bacterium]